jgi:ribose transport system permease protein
MPSSGLSRQEPTANSQIDDSQSDQHALQSRSTRLGAGPAFSALGHRYGVVVAWAVLIAFFGALKPSTFLTAPTFETMFGTQSALLLLALSLVITLTVGEFDLSVASILGLTATVIAVLNGEYHMPIIAAALIGIACGPLVGLINAVIVVALGVDAIIVTLGMGTFILGMAILISHSTAIGNVSPGLINAMSYQVLGLSMSFVYAIACTIAIWYILRYTPVGRYMLFVGNGREVARLAGVRVQRIRLGAYIFGGLVAALGGVITVGLAGGIEADSTSVLLLPAFAAAFLGAAAIEPGRFNAWGTAVAIYFLTTGIVGLELLGLGAWVQDVFYGAALVVGVTISRLSRARLRPGVIRTWT